MIWIAAAMVVSAIIIAGAIKELAEILDTRKEL